MIITLNGFSPDRELQVLDCVLREAGHESISGHFTPRHFIADEDVSPEIVELIATFFAPKSDSELWKETRDERDKRLIACDWTQIADAPLSAEQKQAWATYRQALRDLPQTQADPENIVWPEMP